MSFGMALYLVAVSAAPVCCLARAAAASTPACCRTGNEATCPIHRHRTAATPPASTAQGGARLCRCSTADDLALVSAELMSPVVPRFTLIPRHTGVTGPVVTDAPRIDVPHAPPGPPPKSPALL